MRWSFMPRSRSSTGSAPAAAASSSKNDSIAKVSLHLHGRAHPGGDQSDAVVLGGADVALVVRELPAGGDVVEDRVLPQVEGRHPRGAPGEDAADHRRLEERGDPRLVVPADDVPLRVEAAAQLVDGRRALRVPAMLVVAHPLHADRAADELRHQRRVDRGHVGSVAAVVAGSVEGDDADASRAGCRARRRPPTRTTFGPCVPDQTVAEPSLTSATAQEGPIEPCVWIGVV